MALSSLKGASCHVNHPCPAPGQTRPFSETGVGIERFLIQTDGFHSSSRQPSCHKSIPLGFCQLEATSANSGWHKQNGTFLEDYWVAHKPWRNDSERTRRRALWPGAGTGCLQGTAVWKDQLQAHLLSASFHSRLQFSEESGWSSQVSHSTHDKGRTALHWRSALGRQVASPKQNYSDVPAGNVLGLRADVHTVRRAQSAQNMWPAFLPRLGHMMLGVVCGGYSSRFPYTNM